MARKVSLKYLVVLSFFSAIPLFGQQGKIIKREQVKHAKQLQDAAKKLEGDWLLVGEASTDSLSFDTLNYYVSSNSEKSDSLLLIKNGKLYNSTGNNLSPKTTRIILNFRFEGLMGTYYSGEMNTESIELNEYDVAKVAYVNSQVCLLLGSSGRRSITATLEEILATELILNFGTGSRLHYTRMGNPENYGDSN